MVVILWNLKGHTVCIFVSLYCDMNIVHSHPTLLQYVFNRVKNIFQFYNSKERYKFTETVGVFRILNSYCLYILKEDLDQLITVFDKKMNIIN